MKGGDPLSLLTLCQSNTKVTPGGGDRAKGRLGQRGERAQKRTTQTPSFVCRIVCLLVPFLCHLTLASSPLLAVSDLSFLPLLCGPVPFSFPIHFPLSGRLLLQKLFLLPSSCHLIPFSGFPLHRQPYLHRLLSISPASLASCVTIKTVAVETGVFGNSGREISAVLCLSILLLPCACGGTQ